MVDGSRFPISRLPKALTRGLLLALLVHAMGALVLVLARWRGLASIEAGVGRYFHVFHKLYDSNEPLGLSVSLLILAFSVGALLWWPGHRKLPAKWLEQRVIWALALGAMSVAWAGGHWVYQDYPLSMDEFGAEMQAEIFSTGSSRAPVPEQWRPYAKAMTPIFVSYLPKGEWTSFYLPVYSLLRAGAAWIHPRLPLNALFVGVSVLLVASLARRLLPETKEAPLLAALFLATSSQVLVNGMSFYSMPAHLAFNLFWLWLYYRADTGGWGNWIAVAVVGVLAMGLHQFVMHVLFAAPFLFRLVRKRRWWLSAMMASAYGVGLIGWGLWLRTSRGGFSDGFDSGHMASWWGLPSAARSFDQFMSWVQITTWQAPVVTVLAIVAVIRIRSLSSEMKDVATSGILSGFFYIFFLMNQGHGWGYRYIFPVLGNLALLAAFGWCSLKERFENGRLVAFVAVGVMGAVLVQLPMRALQARSFIEPFARAHSYLASRDADVVIIDAVGSWYGLDLVRSDPLFRGGPVIMNSNRLTQEQARTLSERYRVEMVSPSVLQGLGMISTSLTPDSLVWRDSPSPSEEEVSSN